MEKQKLSSTSITTSKDAATHQNIFADVLKTIADSASDVAVRVLQQGEYMHENEPTSSSSSKFPSHSSSSHFANVVSPPRPKSNCQTVSDTIGRTMGMTGHAMLQNRRIASNQAFTAQLRKDLGGRPTNYLHHHGESVAAHRRRTGRNNSSTRAARNNLRPANELHDRSLEDRAVRVNKRLYQRHSTETDQNKKAKIREAMEEVQKVENGKKI